MLPAIEGLMLTFNVGEAVLGSPGRLMVAWSLPVAALMAPALLSASLTPKGMTGATTPGDQPTLRLRAGILEFLTFVEQHREGWQVLFGELVSLGPVVEHFLAVKGKVF